jgi:hypothetical protein
MVCFIAIYPIVNQIYTTILVNKNLIAYKVASHALVDYTLNGIRLKWCFGSSWLPEDAICDLFHPRSTERMLLSDAAIRQIGDSMPASKYPNPLPSVRLTTIDQTIALNSITSMHPLYRILNSLMLLGATGVRMQISRVDNVNEPTRGQEVTLLVRATILVGPNVHFWGLGSSTLWVESKVMVFPRELSTFALILPNDLYLDGNPSANNYDTSFLATSGAGLRFESPVFVNGNVFVPPPNSPNKNMVTFVERLVLGGGYVYTGQTPFKPLTAGGPNDQYFAQLPGFGGFLSGVELDRNRDIGLDYFASIYIPPSPHRYETV